MCIVTQLSVAAIHIQIIIIIEYCALIFFLFFQIRYWYEHWVCNEGQYIMHNGYSDAIVYVKNPKTEPVPLYFHLFGCFAFH